MGDTAKSYTIKVAPPGRGIDWLVDSFAIFSNNWLAWMAVVVFLLILAVFLAFIPLFGGVAQQLLYPVFAGGLMLGCRAEEQGEGFNFTHLFSGFSKNAGQLMIVGLFYLLGMFVIALFCGLIFLASLGGIDSMMQMLASLQTASVANDTNRIIEVIAPFAQSFLIVVLIGLALYLPLLVLIWFAPALIVLDDIDALQAMKDSFTGCMKNVIPYLVYGIIGLIFSVIATIPLGLGWLVLGPMLIASIYLAYKDIYQKT